MTQPKTAYILACWGEGRSHGHVPKEECLGYLKANIELFNEFDHNLAQLILVHPHWTSTPYEDYQTYLDELDGSTLENGTPIAVRRRPNVNRSYGGFSDVFGEFREQFDYYIFVEDDYVIACHNFDSVLVDLLETKQCDYLCSQISPTTVLNGMTHAGMTAGICKSSAMQKIWDKFGSLLSDEYQDFHWHNQLIWSYPYHHCGLTIDHYEDQYSTPFWYAQKGEVITFRDHGLDKVIFVPIQWYRQNIRPI